MIRAYDDNDNVVDSVEWEKQIRADAIEEYKYTYNVVLFREIFMKELERLAVSREEVFMFRDVCSMAWNKYLDQLKSQDSK